jgi:hypothetical protein
VTSQSSICEETGNQKGKEQRIFVQQGICVVKSYVAVPRSFWGWWNTNPVINGQCCGVDTADHADHGQADISGALEFSSCASFEMEQGLCD